MILERDIEKKLVGEVVRRGGKVIKQLGEAGIPDRLVLAPLGICAFVELKKPGEKLRKLQEHRKLELENLGFDVYVIDSYAQIDNLVRVMF